MPLRRLPVTRDQLAALTKPSSTKSTAVVGAPKPRRLQPTRSSSTRSGTTLQKSRGSTGGGMKLVSVGCPAGIGKHGKRCKYGVRDDGFCCDRPPDPVRTDTVVHRWLDGHGPRNVSYGHSAPPTGSGGAAAAAAAGGASALAKSGAQAVGSYVAGRALLKGAGKVAVKLASLTPYGRAVRYGSIAASAASKLAKAKPVRALLKG